MTKLEQAARQALVALEDVMADFDGSWALADTAITALREALAEQSYDEAHGICSYHLQETEQAEQEPVAWIAQLHKGSHQKLVWNQNDDWSGEYLPLYAAPVRTKDLTDDEIGSIYEKHHAFGGCWTDGFAYERAVIAAYKEKNK